MDDRRVADYFVVAGLPDNPLPLEEFSNEAAIKVTYKQDPVTDITVINKSLGEKIPKNFQCLEKTASGAYPADLNHGSIRSHELYICYRRGRDKPPLTDVGVLYEGKERLMAGCEVVHTTPWGNPANINNASSNRTYITFRRAGEAAASDMLAVVDVQVILENKGESPPHSYCQIQKNLNRGLMGSDVYLCYKKAMSKMDVLAYKPAILDRYPMEDYDNFPLPESVPMFCLPMGASIECWSAKAQHPMPVFSTFIFTVANGEKLYGAAVTFYEEYPEERLTDLQMRHLGLKNKHIREQYRILKTVHYNKSICLLSHWPFFDAFRKFLSYLYKISITGPHTVPLERHISHFMFDVPYPSPQRPRILVQLSHEAISLSMPEDSPLQQSGSSFITLLKNLGPENCMNILLYVLHEHKILIHSLRPAVLTSVAEAVSTMIFPLHWQCPYIPLCPLGLSDVLNAPTPFIVGLDSRYFDLYDPPPDVFCIDLDTIRIWPPEDKKNITYKMLPKKPTKVLQESLHKLYDKLQESSKHHTVDEVSLEIDTDFKKKKKEMMMELAIQEVFLRFMACLIKGYKHYLKPITKAPNERTTDANSLFDMQAFLKSRDKANHKFFNQLMRTQTFIRFIEERSFVSDKDVGLAFFDDCCEKVDETKDEPRLIELDDTHKSERTVFIMPPEPTGLPEGVKYSYNGFPDLKRELFLQKKPSTLAVPTKNLACPSSPTLRRTKQEIKTAQKMAQQFIGSPFLWAKCLLSHCYSLWFIHLPAYIRVNQSVLRSLKTAYDVLKDMQKARLKPPDELCYRVMLQLCGQYNQPVLAVKVYSEMKRAGVQPNAITYGYYNKAVLEGKWPSTISRGALLWRKIRNVINGIAKFRKAIRRRSVSLYSNSGSEYDRTSIDSFLEDPPVVETKHEIIIQRPETVPTQTEADKPNGKASLEERTSTGGTSDRGYSSMTQEEAKYFANFISSANSKEENKFENKLKRDLKNVLRFSLRRKHKKKEKDLLEETDDDTNMNVSASFDTSMAEQFRARLGSIVKRSKSSVSSADSHENLKGNIIGTSSAGLLMVSDSLDPHQSILHGPSNHGGVGIRKRHRSAGDHMLNKTRSNSLLANWRFKHSSGEDKMAMKFSELVARDVIDDEIFVEENTLESSLPKGMSEMQDIKEEIKDSGVALDDNLNASAIEEGNEEMVCETEDGEESKENKCDNGSKDDSLERISEQSDSVKSNTSSPQHSISTPVTENDPLGHFNPGESLLSSRVRTNSDIPLLKNSSSNSPEKETKTRSLPRSVFGVPFQEDQLVVDEAKGMCNNLVQSSDASAGQDSEDNVSVNSDSHGMGKVRQNLFKIERTNSFPDSLVTPEKSSKSRVWPSGRSSSQQSDTGPLIKSSSSLNESVSAKAERSEFSRLFRTGSFRKQKEALSGMWKSAAGAAGAMATKFAVMTQSITTPTKADSNSSLAQSTQSEECDSCTGDDDSSAHSVQETPKKSGSLDFLKKFTESLGTPKENGVRPLPPEPSPNLDLLNDDSPDHGGHHVQFADLPLNIHNIAMEVEISSCCRCNRCRSLMYDEEIMAGWTADDSNLNTSCQHCYSKFVPHLLIYLKDYRGKKRHKLIDTDSDDGNDTDSTSHSSNVPQSYGKDANICSSMTSGDMFFGEEHFDGDSSSVRSGASNPWAHRSISEHSDPWTRLSNHEDSEPSQSRPASEPLNMAEVALAVRRRRTTSECLTSATDNMSLGSSVDSFEGALFPSLRSPLNISIGEEEELPTHPSDMPETKKDFLTRNSPMVEPISVPYLSPIVLRKELENIIASDGYMSLAASEFVDDHPIIFWNLVWYFKRISVTSYMPGLLLTAKSVNKDTEVVSHQVMYNSAHVLIRPMWDNVRIHEEVGLPMYMAWGKGESSHTVDALVTEAQPFNRSVMHQIITNIQCNDVLSPIKLVMNARRRNRGRRKRFRSLYREILFLAFTACGRENIDPDAFDREYKQAFSRLSVGEIKRLQRSDKPRGPHVIWCRKVFGELEV